jgi:hypothetical protein
VPAQSPAVQAYRTVRRVDAAPRYYPTLTNLLSGVVLNGALDGGFADLPVI